MMHLCVRRVTGHMDEVDTCSRLKSLISESLLLLTCRAYSLPIPSVAPVITAKKKKIFLSDAAKMLTSIQLLCMRKDNMLSPINCLL